MIIQFKTDKLNLVVIDYSTCSVDFYHIDDDVVTSDFLSTKGYKESEIAWMRTDHMEIRNLEEMY